MISVYLISVVFFAISALYFRETNAFGLTSVKIHRVALLRSHQSRVSATALRMGARNRAWAKGDLTDKDIFDDDVGSSENSDGKKKFKLDPEITFFDGPPSASELIFPALSIFTVIGIVPFVAAASRQFWVKYKFTSRRISLQSGFGGNDVSEIIYPDIAEIKYVYRSFGAAGDMVLFLKDGAKAELRFVPKFEEIYNYVLSKCDEECQAKSMKLTAKANDGAAGTTTA